MRQQALLFTSYPDALHIHLTKETLGNLSTSTGNVPTKLTNKRKRLVESRRLLKESPPDAVEVALLQNDWIHHSQTEWTEVTMTGQGRSQGVQLLPSQLGLLHPAKT